MRSLWIKTTVSIFLAALAIPAHAEETARARDIGISPGILATGPLNAITDVAGVRVGHITVIDGQDIRTGATAILPHGGNLFQQKVPAAIVVGNGFGKLAGLTQVQELGEIETPIVLTNTLSVARGIDAILDWTLSRPGNEQVVSANAVVGETNDSYLNNIRARRLTPTMIRRAIETAQSGPVAEGSVGAGTGTRAFGWKGGIGTSSRKLPENLGSFTVGVLVQSNFGGVLQIDGVPIGEELKQFYLQDKIDTDKADGSIMIVIATDAPLSDRNLERLARRSFAGLARTGASMTNGSGDYAIAFSSAQSVRRSGSKIAADAAIGNSRMSPLFQATIEATEEAIYNSLLMATSVSSYNQQAGKTVTLTKLPLAAVKRILKQYGH